MGELCVLVYSDGVVLFAQPEGTIAFHSVPGTALGNDYTLYSLVDGRVKFQTRKKRGKPYKQVSVEPIELPKS